MDSLLLEIVETVDHLDLGSSQSVQLRYHKDVPLLKHRKTGTELMSLLQGGGATDSFREHLLAPCLFQFLDLGIQTLLLMGGGCPPISNFSSHCSERITVSRA